MTLNKRLKLKVFVPVEKPEVSTLTGGIYGSANWMERETSDFLELDSGHPNLKRVF